MSQIASRRRLTTNIQVISQRQMLDPVSSCKEEKAYIGQSNYDFVYMCYIMKYVQIK